MRLSTSAQPREEGLTSPPPFTQDITPIQQEIATPQPAPFPDRPQGRSPEDGTRGRQRPQAKPRTMGWGTPSHVLGVWRADGDCW